jgi:KRAB domain-containing zinc finger protein
MESYISWSPEEIGDHVYEVIEEQGVDDIIEDSSGDHGNYGEVEILESENGNDDVDQEYYVGENIIEVPQETFVYYTDDGSVVASDSSNVQHVGVGRSHLIEQRVQEAENKIIGDQEEYTETVEEVITEEDWIQSQGEECVQVAMEQIVASDNLNEEEDDTVPLQINQDEYTSSRPYPCDFCSRRFRKKANLMNHMVAHQNDRPHVCNMCGVRYIRRHDLQNHYKIHTYAPENEDSRRRNYGSSSMDCKY